MPPLYTRRIDRPTGNVYFDPQTGIPTKGVPALGLTTSGLWVPLLLNADGSIVLSSGAQGTPYFSDAFVNITPGLSQTLISEVVPAGTLRSLSQVLFATRITGSFWITVDGSIIGSGRTGPGGYPLMLFNPTRPISAGSTYEVLFQSRLNAPASTVECYLQASDVPQ